MKRTALSLLASLSFLISANAQIRITEFIYQGQSGTIGTEHEFVELTNIGSVAIDMSGWYYRDSTDLPTDPFLLSGFGAVQPGESVLFTDLTESDFRAVWTGVAPSVKILGLAQPGLGRNDTIRIFDNTNTLVDQIAYGDESFPGTPRWRYISANTSYSNLGENDIYGWVQADKPGAWQDGTPNNLTSINGDIGNPGYLNTTAIPEPAAWVFISLAGTGLMIWRRRRQS